MWFLFAIAVAIIWGYSELYYKKSTSNDSNFLLYFWHYMFEWMIFLPICLIFRADLFLNINVELLLRLLPIAIINWVGHFIYIRAINSGKLSIVSPIMSSYYVISITFGVMILNEKVDILQAISIFIIFIAMFLLIRCKNSDSKDEQSNKRNTTGVILAVVYFIAMGINGFGEKFSLNYYFKVLEYLFYYGILCLIFTSTLFIITKIIKHKYKFTLPHKDTALGVFYSNVGNALYIYTLSIGNISLVAPIMSCYTVITEVLSATVLREKLSRKQIFFILLIIFGVLMINI